MTAMSWALLGVGLGVVMMVLPTIRASLVARRHDRELRRRPDYGKIGRLEQELFGDRFIDTARERKVTAQSAADEIRKKYYAPGSAGYRRAQEIMRRETTS